MKKIFCFIFFVVSFLFVFAQNYPSEWKVFTSDKFLYNIVSDDNEENLTEAKFLEYLLNLARINLAKQIEVRIKDYAQFNKQVINGRTSIHYKSSTSFSTDLNIKLLRTSSVYISETQKGYAIAYVDKRIARSFYEKEILNVLQKSDNIITEVNNLVSQGFKIKAKNVLEQNLSLFQQVETPLYWLNVFEIPEAEYAAWQTKISECEQKIKNMIIDLEHATVVYVCCKAQLNGKNFSQIANGLKANLAKSNCSFTNSSENADFIVEIGCIDRNGNSPLLGGVRTYFSYIDVSVSITKTATNQCIYQDEISVKGGHVLGYEEAARVAYKNVEKKLSSILIENIKK